jgi:putative hydrolase of the HAD superfamily
VIKALMIDVDGVLVTGRPSDGLHWATSLEADLGLSFDILQEAFFKEYWEDVVSGRADLRGRLTTILAQIAPTAHGGPGAGILVPAGCSIEP